MNGNNKKRSKLKSLGLALLWVLIFYAAMQLVSIVSSAVVFAAGRPDGYLNVYATLELLQQLLGDYSVWITFATDAVIIAAILIYFALRRNSPRRALRIGYTTPRTLALCAVLGISANVFSVFVISLMPWPESIVNGLNDNYSGIASEGSLFMSLLVFAVMTAIVEEIFFRVLVISELGQSFGRTGCIIISALLFGAVHWNPIAIFYASALGVILSTVYFRYGSVWPGVFIHMFFNIAGILSFDMPPAIYLAAVFISTAAVMLTTYLLLGRGTSRETAVKL